MSRKDYNWNTMYNQIIKIKDEYQCKYQESIVNKSFTDILTILNKTLLLNGATYTQIRDESKSLLLIKYSLLGGIDDIYTNPDSIFREGRSLVIDLISEDIVLCPFRKFFNVDEIKEFSINQVTNLIDKAYDIEVSDKLDGSMQSVRYWHNQFIYSGSSAMDEEQSIQLKLGKQLFFSDQKLMQLVKDFSNYTIIFEALLEEDPHLVSYSGSSLNLIGMRNVYTGYTLSYKELVKLAQQYQIPSTSIENYSFNDLLKQRNQFLATEKEGWVLNIRLPDKDVRIKLKCEDYIKLHALYGELTSPNAVIKEIADETFDDSFSHLPDSVKPRIQLLSDKIYKFLHLKASLIEQNYNLLDKDVNDKEFAIQVNTKVPKEFRHYMFNKRYNRNYGLLKNNINTKTPSYIKMREIEEFLNTH